MESFESQTSPPTGGSFIFFYAVVKNKAIVAPADVDSAAVSVHRRGKLLKFQLSAWLETTSLTQYPQQGAVGPNS